MTDEQKSRLESACAALSQRGEKITKRSLAKEARINTAAAHVYLRQIRSNELTPNERLDQAYERLQANQSKPVSGNQLREEAQVSFGRASAYLHDKRKAVHA